MRERNTFLWPAFFVFVLHTTVSPCKPHVKFRNLQHVLSRFSSAVFLQPPRKLTCPLRSRVCLVLFSCPHQSVHLRTSRCSCARNVLRFTLLSFPPCACRGSSNPSKTPHFFHSASKNNHHLQVTETNRVDEVETQLHSPSPCEYSHRTWRRVGSTNAIQLCASRTWHKRQTKEAKTTMSSPGEWYASLPQVSKTCGTVFLVTTIGAMMQVIDVR